MADPDRSHPDSNGAGLDSDRGWQSAPGAFTAIVRGVNGPTGVGLVEIYAVYNN